MRLTPFTARDDRAQALCAQLGCVICGHRKTVNETIVNCVARATNRTLARLRLLNEVLSQGCRIVASDVLQFERR
jgi:hypothetical protein